MTAAAQAELPADDALAFVSGAADRWDDALLVAALLAIDPAGLKGVSVRAGPGPVRDLWLSAYKGYQGDHHKLSPLPANADEGRIIGGLDLVETLSAGKPVVSRGVLQESDGGTVLVRMAERLEAGAVHALTSAMDQGAVSVERDGLSRIDRTRFSLLLFDEGASDERAPQALEERLAFLINLDSIPLACAEEEGPSSEAVLRARDRLTSITIDDDTVRALGAACLGAGASSIRVQMACSRAALAIAALRGSDVVENEDARLAARLVIAPRATSLPEAPEDEAQEPPPEEPPQDQTDEEPEPFPDDDRELPDDLNLDEIIADAIKSGAVNLDLAEDEVRRASPRAMSGRAGQQAPSKSSGRPIGAIPGDPRRGGRLDILATLRTAAPWKRLRPEAAAGSRVRIYPSDLRIRKYAHRTASSVIFVVDASGSSAVNRLAEAKGAVESLLLECYARRDLVSLITFKGAGASCDLPPCRSLARARRAMAGLPGGGGTPLASAISLALETALREQDEGRAPLLVFLTDGQSNIALDGSPGRPAAQADTEKMAPLLAQAGLRVLFFDTSPRPSDKARNVARLMNATYVPLPYADGSTVSAAVRAEQAKTNAGAGR
ncbi:MAG: magnesium chelatase subunit D [Pseudomonadota bacterium]